MRSGTDRDIAMWGAPYQRRCPIAAPLWLFASQERVRHAMRWRACASRSACGPATPARPTKLLALAAQDLTAPLYYVASPSNPPATARAATITTGAPRRSTT